MTNLQEELIVFPFTEEKNVLVWIVGINQNGVFSRTHTTFPFKVHYEALQILFPAGLFCHQFHYFSSIAIFIMLF
jgi:hypothetical protein